MKSKKIFKNNGKIDTLINNKKIALMFPESMIRRRFLLRFVKVLKNQNTLATKNKQILRKYNHFYIHLFINNKYD